MSGWIGVDLDGTLAEYHGWNGTGEIGNPVPLMLERVKGMVSKGIDVRIFTARVYHDPHGDVERAVQAWCQRWIGVPLPVTCRKDYGMIELWDDRCVQVIANTGRRADGKD